MATLGRREMTLNIPNPISPEGFPVKVTVPTFNLSIISSEIPPVTNLGVRPLGSPIMREDFITATGVKTSALC